MIEFKPDAEQEGMFSCRIDNAMLSIGLGDIDYISWETIKCDEDCEYDGDTESCDYCGERLGECRSIGIGRLVTLKEYQAIFKESLRGYRKMPAPLRRFANEPWQIIK